MSHVVYYAEGVLLRLFKLLNASWNGHRFQKQKQLIFILPNNSCISCPYMVNVQKNRLLDQVSIKKGQKYKFEPSFRLTLAAELDVGSVSSFYILLSALKELYTRAKLGSPTFTPWIFFFFYIITNSLTGLYQILHRCNVWVLCHSLGCLSCFL